jgi:hypothetical protein
MCEALKLQLSTLTIELEKARLIISEQASAMVVLNRELAAAHNGRHAF